MGLVTDRKWRVGGGLAGVCVEGKTTWTRTYRHSNKAEVAAWTDREKKVSEVELSSLSL